jgi:biotin carboxyl carrier protein
MTEAIVANRTYQIGEQQGKTTVNGQPTDIELIQQGPRRWQAKQGVQSHRVLVHKADPETREVTVSVNGKRTTVKLHSRAEQMLKMLGIDQAAKKKLDSLKAPMPGLIHSIKVKEGDAVKKGDALLILEAMKMENVIKASGDAVVARIHVQEKASVEKNVLLITFA